MKRKIKDAHSRARVRIALRQQQVMMLRAQGFTERQIAAQLPKVSIATVHNDIQKCIDRINTETDESTRYYRALLLQQCDEDFGLLADQLVQITKNRRVSLEARVSMIRGIIDSRVKVRGDVIDITGLRKIEATTSSAGEIAKIVGMGLGLLKANEAPNSRLVDAAVDSTS